MTADTQNLHCESMWASFSWGGSANKMQYFTTPAWGTSTCQPVAWETVYNAIDRDAYKRCVCESVLTETDPACQQETTNVDPD